MLSKEVCTDKEQYAMIGLELKSQMDSHDYVFKENKLENVTKMVISLDEIIMLITSKMESPAMPYLRTMCLAPNILRILNQRPHSTRNSKMVRLFP